MKRRPTSVLLALAALWTPVSAQVSRDALTETRGQARLASQIRHELVMMPFYGVFDHLRFRLDGRAVTLMGTVVRPTLRDEAERRVLGLEGVESVTNEIDVLPLSPYDDRIRLASYRAIYSHPSFSRYVQTAVPSVHLLVDHGVLTLEGVVLTQAERNLAGILANGVTGVFQVKNELRVEPVQ